MFSGLVFFFLSLSRKKKEKEKEDVRPEETTEKRDTYEPILIRELPMLRLVIGSVSQFLVVSSFFFFRAHAREEEREKTMKEKEDTARLFPYFLSSIWGGRFFTSHFQWSFLLTVSWVPEFTRMMVSSFLLPHWRVNSRPIEDG